MRLVSSILFRSNGLHLGIICKWHNRSSIVCPGSNFLSENILDSPGCKVAYAAELK